MWVSERRDCHASGEQRVQRLWGRTVPGVSEEQGVGPCGWNRVSKEERGRRGGRGGVGQVVQGLVGRGRTWASILQEAEALEGCGQSRDSALTQVLTGALWWLLQGGQARGSKGRSQATR